MIDFPGAGVGVAVGLGDLVAGALVDCAAGALAGVWQPVHTASARPA
jgi:hypothetical protein